MRDYFWIALTVGVAGFLYCLRIYDKGEYKSTKDLVIKLILGMGGSAFTTLCVYSLCTHNGLSDFASLSIAGACGHLGAEAFVGILQKFLEKRM